MTYTNNQYIRLDIPLEEIAKIKIRTDENNKMISDLEIKEDEPNIVIGYGIYKRIDYCNIFSSVRILITDERTLKGKIEEIPEFIEVIIVNNVIYYDRNDVNSDKEFDLLSFSNDNNRFEMKVERLIEKGKINSSNKAGNTILNYLILNKKKEKASELIDKMKIESINKVNEYGITALIYACGMEIESVALKLLEKEDINVNQANYYGTTALISACMQRMERVALKLLERKDIDVNQVDKFGNTALKYANKYGIKSVINRINEINNK
jgi:ankyrin repeat protein